MTRPHPRHIFSALALLLSACGSPNFDAVTGAGPRPTALTQAPFLGTAHIASDNLVVRIPPSFLGLAHEWIPLAYTQASTQNGLDPVYVQLLKNLFADAAGPLSFRIGGDTQDKLHVPPPATILKQLSVLRHELGAQIIYGLDLKSNNASLTLAQAQAGEDAMPPGAITTLELGNEPDLYPLTHGAFMARFRTIAAPLTAQSNIALGGPSYSGLMALDQFTQFATAHQAVLNMLELHGYLGWAGTPSIDINFILNEAQSAGWANKYGRYVVPAHALNLPVRISEMNSLSGFGKEGVSDTFAAALWTTDILFELLRVGMDGVNLTGSNTQVYAAIKDLPDPQTGARISRIGAPYYGLLLFARATAHGGAMVQVDATAQGHIKVWATRSPDGQVRVVLLNKDPAASGFFQLTGLTPHGTADVAYLDAPAMNATENIVFAGQSYENTTDGLPTGKNTTAQIHDDGQGNYVVPLVPHQAVLVTVAPGAN